MWVVRSGERAPSDYVQWAVAINGGRGRSRHDHGEAVPAGAAGGAVEATEVDAAGSGGQAARRSISVQVPDYSCELPTAVGLALNYVDECSILLNRRTTARRRQGGCKRSASKTPAALNLDFVDCP